MFGFGKKKEAASLPVCGCDGSVERTVQSIKVLGSGCKNCHALLENTQMAIKSMGLAVDVEYVIDLQKVMDYGVMSMPALVVNEQIVSTGKVLKPDEVEKLLHNLGY